MITTYSFRKHRIGFVSTRFSSTDGVSLETRKWAHVLAELGQELFYFAGVSDQPAEVSCVVPEAHFSHPDVHEITQVAYSLRSRPPEMTRRIHELRNHLKKQLYFFIKKFDIELLIVENALSIPLNIPLGLALAELIAETSIPTIGHHHDFAWERKRFLVNCIDDYLDMAFPPRLPSIQHVVINSLAAAQLGRRRGLSTYTIPNVMDFDHPPAPPDEYTETLKGDLGVGPDEYLFLQPTRIVRRKGIEHAVELIQRLGVRGPLVISHAGGDEGDSYEAHVRKFAELLKTDVTFVSQIIDVERGFTPQGQRIYSLGDVYHFADLVTYPSLLEGFGNAFLEAIYYRRPILVNNYTIYATDIKPRGFWAIEFDGFITEETVEEVRGVLEHPENFHEQIEHNYQLARRFFSYTILRRQLTALLYAFFGEEMDA
jgi:glycosyltransferase involved in cell wall biosynthesis